MQSDFFDREVKPYNGQPPFVAGSDTSRAASASVADGAHSIRAKVYGAIGSTPSGLTCDQIETDLGLRHQTASARVRELYLKGFIRDSGERRATRTGRGAVVWKVSAKAECA